METWSELPMTAGEDRMNVLFLTDLFLPHAGGARIYYYNLYKNLVEQFPDRVTVLTKKIPGWQEFDRRESTAAMRIVRRGRPWPNWKYYQLPRIVPTLGQAMWHAQTGRPDLVHFGDLCPPGIISTCLKSLMHLPYLAYCHGDENSQIDGRRYQPMVRDYIYREASAVVAANEYAKQGLIRIGVPEGRVHKLTPGVDLERFRPKAADPELVKRYGLAGNRVLFTAARLVPKKGFPTALRAVAEVHREIPNLRYLIAGDGPERSRLEALVRELGLGEVVTFLGDISNHDLPEYYNLGDVFLMTNRRTSDGDIETFGMVFIEANAAGKPVVAGRSGGAPEAVADGVTGFLVEPDDAAEAAAALKRLLTDDELRQRMGADGLRRAQTDFQWKSRAQALRQISTDIVEARAGTMKRAAGALRRGAIGL